MTFLVNIQYYQTNRYRVKKTKHQCFYFQTYKQTNKKNGCNFLTRMLMIMVTVSVLVGGVIVLVVISFMALVLLLKP